MQTNANEPPRVVTMGGGTGHSVLLAGLKEHPVRLTAILSMADDGGSSGILRDELGVLPPGDVLMCLVALSDAPLALRELFQYRFEDGSMSGHTLGNMFLSALEKTTGSFSKAAETAGRILKAHGRVVPVSEDDMRLLVTLKDNTVLRGEHYLNDNEQVREKGVDHVSLETDVAATDAALDAIVQADMIVLGPGGLHDSLLPPLLVKGIPEAIRASSAKVVYIGNLTNKKGQTDGFNLHDYARILNLHIGASRIDSVLFGNTSPDPDLLRHYEEQEGAGAFVACPEDSSVPYEVVLADVLSSGVPLHSAADKIAKSRSIIRHDSGKLARELMTCLK